MLSSPNTERDCTGLRIVDYSVGTRFVSQRNVASGRISTALQIRKDRLEAQTGRQASCRIRRRTDKESVASSNSARTLKRKVDARSIVQTATDFWKVDTSAQRKVQVLGEAVVGKIAALSPSGGIVTGNSIVLLSVQVIQRYRCSTTRTSTGSFL